VALRSRAVRMGFKLSEYGLFRSEDDTLVCSETEEQIYEALGLRWIPPEMRENLGEIERAAEDRLPRLVELSDIRGDLHMHTRETDGRATLEEMAEAARARATPISPSPTIPRPSPWLTDSTKPAWWRSPNRSGRSTKKTWVSEFFQAWNATS